MSNPALHTPGRRGRAGSDRGGIRRSLLAAVALGIALAGVACQGQGAVAQLPATASDPVRYHAQQCDQGEATGCHALAWAYLASDDHHGLQPDRERALVLLQRACELGQSLACSQAESFGAGEAMTVTPPEPPVEPVAP